MKNFVIAVVLSLCVFAGSASATGRVATQTVFVNAAGHPVVFVRNQPVVNVVQVRRAGFFGFQRVVVQQAYTGAVFTRQFVPGVGFVSIRVR